MSISSIAGSLPGLMNGKTLKDLMKELAQEKALQAIGDQAAESEPAPQAAPLPQQQAGSLMSHSFLNPNSEESRYVKATMDSFDALREMKYSQIADAWAASDNLGGATGGIRQLKQRQKELEDAEKHLKETRDAIEHRAQEAMAPTDAEGNPIDTGMSEGPETPPMAETAAAATAAAPAEAEPEPTPAATGATASLNITV